jgi:Arc/MetJ-type ribon-helix-helix transcriptional regulator
MSEKDRFTLTLPRELVERIQKKIEGTEFESVQSYIEFVLNEVMDDRTNPDSKQTYSKEEEERIQGKLRSLGYV